MVPPFCRLELMLYERFRIHQYKTELTQRQQIFLLLKIVYENIFHNKTKLYP